MENLDRKRIILESLRLIDQGRTFEEAAKVMDLSRSVLEKALIASKNRQEAIRKSLDDARQAKDELERLRQESAQILKAARVEAEGIVAQSRTDAERLREELKQKAKADADGIARNAERQIQLETGRALQQVRREAVDLSLLIASKILQRNLSKEDNERLIEEALRQIETPRH